MFKHLLVPTDGSSYAESAVRCAVFFAQSTGARVTTIYVKPEFQTTYDAYGVKSRHPMDGGLPALQEAEAQKALGHVEELCRELGVACTRLSATSDSPHHVIVEAATQNGCDLIFMASHGRGGFNALHLGSEADKVLLNSRIPVLIYR